MFDGLLWIFFFSSRRRHTRYWRDWSSDVCSSDLACRAGTVTATYAGPMRILGENNAPVLDPIAWYGGNSGVGFELEEGEVSSKIGRASCRGRVEISVVAVSLTKKHSNYPVTS